MLKISFFLLAVLAFPTSAYSQEHCPKTGEKPGDYSKLSVGLCWQDMDDKRRGGFICSSNNQIAPLGRHLEGQAVFVIPKTLQFWDLMIVNHSS